MSQRLRPFVIASLVIAGSLTVSVARAERAPGVPPRVPFVSIGLGPESTTRFVRYNDALSPSLANYSLPIAAAIATDLEIRPLASSSSIARGLALHGEGHFVLGLRSKPPGGGEDVATTFYRWGAALRFGLSPTAAITLGPMVGVLAERFETDAVPGLASPNVDAKFVRLGLFGRVVAGPATVLVSCSYLPALVRGELGDRFRGTTSAAVEGSLGVEIPLSRALAVRANAIYTRAFYAFDPQPGDGFVAGGALDHILRGQALAVLSF